MRIDTGGVYANRSASRAPSEAAGQTMPRSAGEGGSDNVTVSSHARLLALGQTALDAAPVIRTPAVEAARAKLRSGADMFEGAEIARAMMDRIAETDDRSGDAASIAPASNDDRHVGES